MGGVLGQGLWRGVGELPVTLLLLMTALTGELYAVRKLDTFQDRFGHTMLPLRQSVSNAAHDDGSDMFHDFVT